MNLARRLMALLLVLGLIACTSTRAVGTVTPANVRAQVQAGDKIWLRSRDGAMREFRVTRVDAQGGLHGDGVDVAADDIRELRIQEVSVVKTAGLTLAVLAVATLAFAHWVIEDGLEDTLGRQDQPQSGGSGDNTPDNNGPLL